MFLCHVLFLFHFNSIGHWQNRLSKAQRSKFLFQNNILSFQRNSSLSGLAVFKEAVAVLAQRPATCRFISVMFQHNCLFTGTRKVSVTWHFRRAGQKDSPTQFALRCHVMSTTQNGRKLKELKRAKRIIRVDDRQSCSDLDSTGHFS